MSNRTTFRFEYGGISFELSGTTDFVRRNLPLFLPFVERVAGRQAGSDGSTKTARTADLATWYDQRVPAGQRLTMQDNILVFAYWMRTFKKFIFTSEDIRRGFEDVGQAEPKSLLQILGTLKREHNLILGTERRGEYMLNTTGIERARQLLGIPRRSSARRGAPTPPEPGEGESPGGPGNDDIAAARAALGL